MQFKAILFNNYQIAFQYFGDKCEQIVSFHTSSNISRWNGLTLQKYQYIKKF